MLLLLLPHFYWCVCQMTLLLFFFLWHKRNTLVQGFAIKRYNLETLSGTYFIASSFRKIQYRHSQTRILVVVDKNFRRVTV